MADPTGNLADLINNVFSTNNAAINVLSSVLGTAADLSGAIGLVNMVVGLFGGSDPTQAALQEILTTVQKDFAQLNAADKAERIIQRLQNLDNITGPAETQLEQLQAHMPTDIGQCLNAINELALNPDAISNWQGVFSDQLFWTDSGEYFQFPNLQGDDQRGVDWAADAMDAGYGQQTPPEVGENLVFSYLYVLPDFLRTLAIFIAVAGSDDPKWVSDYGPQVLQPVAGFLKNNVHDTIASGITQLSPGSWDGQSLWKAVGIPPLAGPSTPSGKWPWQGVSAIPAVPQSINVFNLDIIPPIPTAIGANLEFGAVEKFSGYSSIGNYQIFFGDTPDNSTDPAPFNKFQIRLLKRAHDVYIGVGLLQVWNVINTLNALVGAPPAPRHPFAGWSFRQLLQLSGLQPDPATNKFSLYSLAGFINRTPPLDTDQAAPNTSFQELLNHFQFAPPKGTTVVPNLFEFSETTAAKALRAVGLVPFFANTGSWVESQEPVAGTAVAAGTTVRMSLRSGPLP
jgi:hypothetical protein